MAAICLAGCDGDKDSPGGGNSGPVQIRGSERLGWRQTSESLQALRLLSFRLYVSDNVAPLADTRCGDALVSGAYECSGRLPGLPPGRYDLQVTAVSSGGESARSAALTVIVGTGSSADATSQSTGAGATKPAATTACVGGVGAGDCYGIRAIAAGLGDVEWLTPADAGSVFFVEDRWRVRIIRDDVLMEWAALESTGNSEIVGLAVDPDFARTRQVFVASASPADTGLALTITRYRDLEGILGEGAPLVSGLTITPGSAAPLALDPRGFLYVAQQPSTVLRFTTEGFVPRANLHGSPIVAATRLDSVTDLSVDPSNGRVWIVSNGTEWPHSLATIPRTVEQDSRWPARPAPPDRLIGWGSTGRAASIGFATPASGDGSWLLISTGADLLRGLPTAAGITQLQPVLFDGKVSIRAAAGGADRSWYVLAEEAGARLSVWKLTRQRAASSRNY